MASNADFYGLTSTEKEKDISVCLGGLLAVLQQTLMSHSASILSCFVGDAGDRNNQAQMWQFLDQYKKIASRTFYQGYSISVIRFLAVSVYFPNS